MQDITFRNITEGLSSTRIEAYRTNTCKTHADVITRYIWNIALCEAFYPCLNTLEVGLRNASDRALTLAHGKFWLENNKIDFDGWQLDSIEQVQSELARRNKSIEHDRLVAELPFGFWASLYNRRFERAWRGILKHAFPRLRGELRTRRTIAVRLDDIRRFRNRVFHHERIIHQPFMRFHSEIRQTIDWMNDDLATLVQTCDRVTSVYDSGPIAFLDPLLAAFSPPPETNA